MFRNMCYYLVKILEVIIYNSLVFNTLKNIENSFTRMEYYKVFRILQNPKYSRLERSSRMFPMYDSGVINARPLLLH